MFSSAALFSLLGACLLCAFSDASSLFANTSSATSAASTITAYTQTYRVGNETITTVATDPYQISQWQWTALSSSYWASASSAADAGQIPLLVTTSTWVPGAYVEPVYSVRPYYTYGDDFTAYYAYYTTSTTSSEQGTPRVDIWTITEYPSFALPSPTCKTAAPSDCGLCTFAANSLQLIAFPVITAPRQPQLDDPAKRHRVYLKYDNVSAVNSCGTVGSVYPGAVLTLTSDQVSTLLGDGTYFHTASLFNYADLVYPVPWTAYVAMMGCQHAPRECVTQLQGYYNPWVSIPPQIRSLDPAWASCTIDPLAGTWDPPYALTPVAVQPTLAAPSWTLSPVAGATPTMSQAPITSHATTASSDPTAALQPVSESSVEALSSVHTQLTSSDPQDHNSASNPTRIDESGSFATPYSSPISAVVIGTQTLLPGSPLTVSGTVYSLPPTPTAAPPSPSLSALIVGTQTLLPGSQITISGTIYSLPSDPTALIIGDSTVPVPTASAVTTAAAALIFGSSTYTQDSAFDLIIGSETLTPGGVVTISGTVVSLDPEATNMVLGGTSIVGLGGLIMSGFGIGGGSGPSGTASGTGVAIEVFTGGVGRKGLTIWWMLVEVGVVLGALR